MTVWDTVDCRTKKAWWNLTLAACTGRRAALDKLVELTEIEVAPQVIQHQAEHMYETFASNISRQGIPVDQYLQAMGRDYTVIGNGGSVNPFDEVRYPAMSPTGATGDTRNCNICHMTGTAFNLPLGTNAVVDPQGELGGPE